jgi:uncharacterized membrane protein
MKVSPLTVAAAVAGAVSLAAVATTTPAVAAKVKCFGVAKAGQNDCNTKAGHDCAGHSKVSYSGMDFKTVASSSDCMKMGGQLKPFKGKGKMGMMKDKS